MKWEELAYSLLEARPNDAVKLALAVAEGSPQPEGADLRALVELEVKPGGGVRVELMDKGAALGAILKAGLPQDGDPEAVASFFAALQGPPGRSLYPGVMEKLAPSNSGTNFWKYATVWLDFGRILQIQESSMGPRGPAPAGLRGQAEGLYPR